MRRIAPPLALLLLALLACASSLLDPRTTRAADPSPKVVIDLTVSTEWQPGSDDRLPVDLLAAGCADSAATTFVSDLEAGLREFARYFYSYSGGQMAIGTVTIDTSGAAWERADIRILANRSYRPTAFVGGIVDLPTPYHASPASTTPATVFYPAAIMLGRLWDGSGARCGPWSAAAGWRTLGHEWGHHALYLYDEYFDQHTGAAQLCDEASLSAVPRRPRAPSAFTTTLRSLMAYHYAADQLSSWPDGAPPRSCRDTPQTSVHGESNWATVTRFYGRDGVTAADPRLPGPTNAPPISVVQLPPAAPPTITSAQVRVPELPGRNLVGQAYLIRPTDSSGAPQRILGQGNLVPGEQLPAQFWGVQTDNADRAAILVQDLIGGQRFSYPLDYRSDAGMAPLTTAAINTLSAKPSSWQPALTIVPRVTTNQTGGSDVTGLRVQLDDCSNKPPSKVELVYCPAGGDCGAPVVATQLSERSFTYTFDFAPGQPPAAHGYIYAREPLRGAETLTWYQLAGGIGPTHIGAHAPQLDGLVQVDLPQNDGRAVGDNQVLYSPAPVCVQPQQLPPPVLSLIGPPLSMQPVIADASGGQPWGESNPALRVRLSYDQDLLDRMGIAEERLVLLRLTGQGWQIVPVAGRSFALDWIAGAPQTLSAKGETYVLGVGPAQAHLPLVLR